ncbi:MAG: PEGA domain-containing protein [Deltaproteobacteria bacterium]|nr:PEGA domain-containing protein [Deltaproteobacteria bacterium]
MRAAVSCVVALIALTPLAAPANAAEPTRGLAQEGPNEALLKARANYEAALKLVKKRQHQNALALFEEALPELGKQAQSADLFYNLVQVARASKLWKKVLVYGQGFVARERGTPDAAEMQKVIDQAVAKLSVHAAPVKLTFVAPEGAEVYVDDAPVPERAFLVAAGSHKVTASLRDHDPWKKDLVVVEGAPQTVQVDLVATTYRTSVSLEITPPDGVTVFLDDGPLGVTPLAPLSLEVKHGKRYLVRLEKVGYEAWTRYLDLERNVPYVLKATLSKIKPPVVEPKPL